MARKKLPDSKILTKSQQSSLCKGGPYGAMPPSCNGDMTLDQLIEYLGSQKIGDVVALQEGTNRKLILFQAEHNITTKAGFLVCRLYTDAIFNNDIRCIQTIINRVDGGLPKDTEVAMYRTSFADCVEELLTLPASRQTAVFPDDSVMMALAKALYDIACEDLYWDTISNTPRRPSDNKRMLRDNAMRMILERAGGRKTKARIEEEEDEIIVADWIQNVLEEGKDAE